MISLQRSHRRHRGGGAAHRHPAGHLRLQPDADVMRYAETISCSRPWCFPLLACTTPVQYCSAHARERNKIGMLSSLVMNVVNIGSNHPDLQVRHGRDGCSHRQPRERMIACFVMFLLQKPDCALRIDPPRDLKAESRPHQAHPESRRPPASGNMFQVGKLSVSSLTNALGTAAITANAGEQHQLPERALRRGHPAR